MSADRPPRLYQDDSLRPRDSDRTSSTPSSTVHGLPTDDPSETFQRLIENVHRHLDNFARLLAQQAPGISMSSGSDRDRDPRLRLSRDDSPRYSPTDAVPPAVPSLPPLRSLGSRIIRAGIGSPLATGPLFRSTRYRPAERGSSDRFRSHLEARAFSSALSDLDDSNTQLRALLDMTNGPLMPPRIPPILPPPHGPDPLEDTRRFKRRRLDSDRPSGEFKTIRYGKQGQVEPGTLTMELVSCDGGIYDEDPNHLPENVLKNDDSVYCTKGNRCNIVLRHHGGTVFSVKELVIKAPKSRFSAPVREGMVFVALEADERFARTTQYQIQFQPARVQSRSGSTLYSQQQEDGSHIPRYYARHRRPYEYGAEDEDEDDDDDEDDDEEEEDEEDEEGDHSLAQIPPEFTISHNLHTVTTELSDDESNEDAPHRGLPRRRTPNRIGSLSFESESSDDGMGPNWEGRHFPMWAPLTENTFGSGRHHHYGSHGSASRAAASSSSHGPASSGRSSREIQPSTGGSGTQDVAQDSARSNGNSELLSPLAHFFIKKGKSRCTIHFDPPISARYLLLKMWCPEGDGCGKNIDIQAVIVKGFAGPRFSPAFELA